MQVKNKKIFYAIVSKKTDCFLSLTQIKRLLRASELTSNSAEFSLNISVDILEEMSIVTRNPPLVLQPV